jgi:hypothetical protein
MNIRTQIINAIITASGARSYLEIGCQNRDNNFNHIRCPIKVCVDIDPKAEPDVCMSSDEFFKQNHVSFDVIFVDGDHSYKQASRDIFNAITWADKFVFCHDTNPIDKAYTSPDWSGEVYKAIIDLRNTTDLDFVTFLEDPHGLTVINVNEARKHEHLTPTSFEEFQAKRDQILRVEKWSEI